MVKKYNNAESAALPAYSIESGDAPMIEQVAWLGEGDYCCCYLVNDCYVFRFAKHAAASAAMQVECCLLPILHKHLPVAVPQVALTGRCNETGNALMGYCLLADPPLERAVLECMSATQQLTLIHQLADVMRQLHDLPPHLADHCNLPVLNPLVHLATAMQRARTMVQPRLPATVWHHYEQLWHRYSHDSTLHTYQPAMLHGDLSPDHVLADTQQLRLNGIIDWGDACIGDPAWDLVYIYEDYGPNIFNAFIDRYDSANVQLLKRKVRLYQHLNNLNYCCDMVVHGDAAQIDEALAILHKQMHADDV